MTSDHTEQTPISEQTAEPTTATPPTPEESSEAKRGRKRRVRRRPGRFRRWVLRSMLWGLAGLAVLIFVLQQLLDTRWARDGARELITQKLSVVLDREVTITDLTFELLPLSVELWGLTISGPDPDGPLFIEIPFAAIDADLNALQHRRLHLREVRVERPVVYVEFFPDGSHNMLKLRRDGPLKPRRYDIFIDRLEIDRAEFGLDQQSVHMSIAADSVRTRMHGIGEMHLAGQLDAHNVVLRLPNARPMTVATSGRGSIRRGVIELESARISGPGVAITGRGTCELPREARERRKCLFQARGSIHGEMLADLGYFQDLNGAVDFDGTLSWRPRLTGWRSRIAAEQLEIFGRRIEDFQGSLVADRYGFRIGIDQTVYAAGRLGGEVAWEPKEDGRPWTVDLAFRGLDFDTVLADQQVPSAGYASRLGGRFTYRFPALRSGRGDGRGELELVADPQLPGLALTGAFPLRIAGGVVRTDSISLRSERQSVLASGHYDLETGGGAYDYEITSADLPELIPVLPLDHDAEPPLWLPTAGRGELAGTLYLAPEQAAAGRATTDLRLRLENVVAPGAAARFVSGTMHLTEAAAESLRLELGDGNEALLLHGEMPYVPDVDRPIALNLEAFNWPVASARPWLDFELPIGGRISGHLDLLVDDDASSGELEARVSPASLSPARLAAAGTGTARPEAAAPATADTPALADVALADVDLDSLNTHLRWDVDQIRFDSLELVAPSGVVNARGTLGWTTGALDLELRSASLALSREPLRLYLPRADIRGEVSVSGRLGGFMHDPRLELVVGADSLALGRRVLEGRSSRLEVSWENRRFSVAGRLLDMVGLTGGGLLEPERAELDFHLDGNDLRGLAELLLEEPPSDLEGTFEGSLRIRSRAEESTAVELRLDELEIELADRQLRSLEPVRARLEAEHLTIDSLYLGEAATDSRFFLAGTVAYVPPAPLRGDVTPAPLRGDVTPTSLSLKLESTLECGWLELFDLGFDVGGTLDVLGTIGGSFERPTFNGQGELSDGSVLLSSDYPLEISNLEGVVSFHPGHVVLDRLTGELGGGRVTLLGEATLPPPEEPLVYRLRLTGSDLDLRYIEGWSVRGDTRISLASDGDGHLLDGHVRLEKLEYAEDIRADFEQLMRGFLQRQRLEVDPTDSVLSTVELNIDVEAPAAVKVRNNLADLTGSAQLLVRGDLAQPVLYGEVELDPEGTLRYNSTDYAIERGRVVFANPYELDPEIDLVAVTRVREFDVTLAVDGTFDRLETRFSSEPPLPDLEVFRLLASGGDEATDTTLMASQRTEVEADASTSAATFLYGQAASVIGQRVNNLFGFDKFRIDPLTGSGDQLSKARVTVGKRLSKDVFVTLSADPSSTEDQRLMIEWQMSPGLSLILTQNGDSSYSADARWESSF